MLRLCVVSPGRICSLRVGLIIAQFSNKNFPFPSFLESNECFFTFLHLWLTKAAEKGFALDYYEGTMADQYNLQSKVGTGGIRRKPVFLVPENSPASNLLQQTSPLLKQDSPVLEQDAHLPKSWPTEPEVVKSSVISIILDILVEIILLALSLAFFAFGLTVRYYDQASIALHQGMVNKLLEATRYVSKSLDSFEPWYVGANTISGTKCISNSFCECTWSSCTSHPQRQQAI